MDALNPDVRHSLYSKARELPFGRLKLWRLWLLVCLTCPGLVTAADQCPLGQQRMCIGACFCAPADSALLNQANRLLGAELRNRIVESRQRAMAGDVRPIPRSIRAQLETYFDPQTLDAVRYRVGDDTQANLSYALLQNQDVSAVTLVDLIVFRNAGDAQDNVILWAHELVHVQQYRELGIDEFSTRYVRDYVALESPAYQMQSRVRYALKQAAELAAHAGAGENRE